MKKIVQLKKNVLLLIAASFMVSGAYSQIKIFENPVTSVSEVSINSKHSDFGPSVVMDSLYFTTFNDKLNGKSTRIKSNRFYDLYKAGIDKEGNITGIREPLKEFITKYNDGPVAWCKKTGELFITQNYIDMTQKEGLFTSELNRLRIMIAKKVNGKWEQVEDFPYNNPSYSIGHPAINETGDTLIFSSDRPGGYGETDLYFSVRKDGKWGEPVNLGPQINTSGKEEFSFLTDRHLNGRFLIFASTGRFGNGGLDLYYCRFPYDNSGINHFDPPINSPYDDFSMTIPKDADYGYFTSNRPGKGSDDIYRFTFKRVNIPVSKYRNLYVFDKNSLKPIPGVRITSCDKQNYLTDPNGKISTLPRNTDDCIVTSNAFGYPEKTKTLSSLTDNQPLANDTLWLEMLRDQNILLKNIYYDFDKWDILPEAAQELDKLVSLMKENPDITVLLSSHTDERGSELYNLKLSQLRAEAAVNYIVSKGINPIRILGTGYGKTRPIHKCADPKSCSPELLRENRRTEILIPGVLKGEPVKQVKGDYSDGQPGHSSKYGSARKQ